MILEKETRQPQGGRIECDNIRKDIEVREGSLDSITQGIRLYTSIIRHYDAAMPFVITCIPIQVMHNKIIWHFTLPFLEH